MLKKKKKVSTKKDKLSNIETFLELGFDPINKIIMLEDKGPGLSVRYTIDFIKKLHHLDSLNKKPITIIINHTGGDEFNGLAVYDAIMACKSPTIGKVYGNCMSMATIILQACQERLLAPHATVMFHIGSNGYSGNHKQTNYSTVEYEKGVLDVWCDNILFNKIQEKQSITRKSFDQMNKDEKWMSAQDAISMGLADRLLNPKIDNIF